MSLRVLYAGCRAVTVQLGDEGLYELPAPAALRLDGKDAGTARTVIVTLWHLSPGCEHTLEADLPGGTERIAFRTAEERVTFDVRRFGARGDGEHEDTAAIQAAILACPDHGRVLVPRGVYPVLPLFLRSHITLELAEGAVLRLIPDRDRFPILPGTTLTADGREDVCLGTWEGDPLDSFASLITGVEVEDVTLCGQGVLDGGGAEGDWWKDAKRKRGAWRGNLLFLCRCADIRVQGLTFRNSPAWNLHPYFSRGLRFLGMKIEAPADSPNTDGFDPESCEDVLLAGTHFSVGDDCVAVKSGKLYMGRRYHTPNSRMEIAHCLMEDGHGGVTVGSEMAGGIRGLWVHDCVMRRTDRGLRIKTRRGRGRDGVIDDVVFERIRMERVRAPFVANSLYYCDPDGHSPYVQSTEPQPVDERTPRIGTLTFRHIDADGAACAGWFLGLPEQPIEAVVLEDVTVRCDPDAVPFQPAMADCVPAVSRTGFVLRNVAEVRMEGVTVEGCEGEAVTRAE